MNTLAAALERGKGEFVGGRASGSQNQNLALLGVFRKESRGVFQDSGVRARMDQRAPGHKQLYLDHKEYARQAHAFAQLDARRRNNTCGVRIPDFQSVRLKIRPLALYLFSITAIMR
jgi:hypothetical protein